MNYVYFYTALKIKNNHLQLIICTYTTDWVYMSGHGSQVVPLFKGTGLNTGHFEYHKTQRRVQG